ncbi:hypothetical protein [Paracidovorax sp. MALMAid1276]|uniref:hypothetical protein n=1 Tax=Paracidovorax sp. MALMAid1276 TaxID=3411631 RepID=UPI003B9D59D2
MSQGLASGRPAFAASPEQQQVLERIAAQRERLRARRAARAQSLALAEGQSSLPGGVDESTLLRVAGFARAHPIAVAAVAAGAVVAGPRRIIRWAGVVLPWVLRLRRKAM